MRKKLFGAVLSMLAAVLVISALGSPAQAVSTRTKAVRAYKSMLSKSTLTWHGCGSTKISTKNCEFRLVSVDSDSVPELIVSNTQAAHAQGYYSLYTYRDGKVRFVANLGDSASYYSKTGVFLLYYMGGGSEITQYCRLSKGKRTYKLRKSGSDSIKPPNFVYSYAKYSSNRWNSISKSSFSRQLRALVGKKSRTNVSYKLHKNTSQNRSRYLK